MRKNEGSVDIRAETITVGSGNVFEDLGDYLRKTAGSPSH